MGLSNSAVSRDFAFLIENALPGPYVISFDYCIDEITIITQKDGAVEFNVDVVASGVWLIQDLPEAARKGGLLNFVRAAMRDVFCACGAVGGIHGQAFLH